MAKAKIKRKKPAPKKRAPQRKKPAPKKEEKKKHPMKEFFDKILRMMKIR